MNVTVRLTNPCPRTLCGGTLVPDEATLHLDADGSAMIETFCNSACGMSSVSYFTWDSPEEMP